LHWQEPHGYCENCGQDLDTDPDGDHDETHRLCWGCWRAENHPPEIEPSVADRRFERLMARMSDIERRLDRLESERVT
jgi:hypothetical protein